MSADADLRAARLQRNSAAIEAAKAAGDSDDDDSGPIVIPRSRQSRFSHAPPASSAGAIRPVDASSSRLDPTAAATRIQSAARGAHARAERDAALVDRLSAEQAALEAEEARRTREGLLLLEA